MIMENLFCQKTCYAFPDHTTSPCFQNIGSPGFKGEMQLSFLVKGRSHIILQKHFCAVFRKIQ